MKLSTSACIVVLASLVAASLSNGVLVAAQACNTLQFHVDEFCDENYFAFQTGVCYNATVYISNIDGTGTYHSSKVVCSPSGGCAWFNYQDAQCQTEAWHYGGLACHCVTMNVLWTVTINGYPIQSWSGSNMAPPTLPPAPATPAPVTPVPPPPAPTQLTLFTCDPGCTTCNVTNTYQSGVCDAEPLMAYLATCDGDQASLVMYAYPDQGCSGTPATKTTYTLNQCVAPHPGVPGTTKATCGPGEGRGTKERSKRRQRNLFAP